MRTLIFLLVLTTAVLAQTPAKIGQGCTTAYFIDKDCDGHGVAIRSDGNYTTTDQYGNMPDADDNDPAVNSVADWRTKYGSGSTDTSFPTLQTFLLKSRGYNITSSRTWFIAPTSGAPDGYNGNDSTCLVGRIDLPCATPNPIGAAGTFNDGGGGMVIYRGGTYTTSAWTGWVNYPLYVAYAASSSSPFITMAYPGELMVFNASGTGASCIETDYGSSPPTTPRANVILDGFVCFQNTGAGNAVFQVDVQNWTFRNMEFVGFAHGLQQNNHIQNILIEQNVFHDNSDHVWYPGYSTAEAVPHPIGVDLDQGSFFTVTDPANYACLLASPHYSILTGSGEGVPYWYTDSCNGGVNFPSLGADANLTFRNNIVYRNGAGAFDALHVNSYINGFTITGNIMHDNSGPGAIGLQTGAYNGLIANNLIFNQTGGCAIQASEYDGDNQAATLADVTIINNTIWSGNNTGNPGCGLFYSDNTGNSGNVIVTNGSNAVKWANNSNGDGYGNNDRFSIYWQNGDHITINGVVYAISSVANLYNLTLTTNFSDAACNAGCQYDYSIPSKAPHWMKRFTVTNNIFATDNPSANYGQANAPFVFKNSSYPLTHTITNNLFWRTDTGWVTPSDLVMTQMAASTPGSAPTGGTQVLTSDGVTYVWSYNLAQFQAYYPNGSTNIVGNPLFVSAAIANNSAPQLFDFHLEAGSPAINLGVTTGAPSVDLQGNPRTGQPDAGAYEFGGSGSPSVPVISSFAPSPSVIGAGTSSTLSWSVSGATSLSIDQSVGPVSGTSITVSPATTTTYTLTASNSIGSTTSTVTVGVVGGGTVTAVSGNNQSGAVGQALSSPFVVAVTDASTNPVSGVQVTFGVTSGAGTLSAAQATTNASGQAATVLTFGASAGATTVTATALGFAGSPVTFTATTGTAAGTAANVVFTSGNNLSGPVGQALSSPFVVTVTDGSGNPVSGVQVTFAVVSGGGKLSATQSTTNAQGQASSTLTLGATAGVNVVTASAGALSGSPVTFTATGTAAGTGNLGPTWIKTGPNFSNGVLVGTWPYFRGYNRLVYDPILGRTLSALSENGLTIYSDSYWAYDSTAHTWAQKTTTGTSADCNTPLGSSPPGHPANRHPYHGLAYDTTRSQMYLFSGVCSGYDFADTWAYKSSMNTWTQMSPSTAPGGRTETAMTYDAAHDVVVLYGGIAPYSQSNDTWQYAPVSNTWTQIMPSTTPGPLAEHALVYDSVNRKVVLFGGNRVYQGPGINNTWIYDAGAQAWSNPNPSVAPPGVTFPAMAFDSKRGLVVLYAGTSQMWTYNVATNQWSQLAVSGGPAPTDVGGNPCSQCLTMAYDAGTDKYILTSQDSSWYTATWELSPGNLTNPYDLNGDGVVNVLDVQIAIDQAMGVQPCTSADFNGDGQCTAADVQIIISIVLGQ